MKRFAERHVWVLFFAVVSLFVALQIFVPPFVGLANNGDYGRVISRFAFAPANGWGDEFIFFVADYQFDPRNYWNAAVPTVEVLLFAPTAWASRLLNHGSLDIRIQGAVHLTILLLGVFVLLRAIRRYPFIPQLLIGCLVVWILTDVRYVALLNSFYTDTAALLGLLLAASSVVYLLTGPVQSTAGLALFTLGSVLVICSKTQHTPLVFVALLILFAICGELPRPYLWSASCVLLLCAVLMWSMTSVSYNGGPLFNAVFYKILPSTSDPVRSARELGITPEERKWIGTHSYLPGNPFSDPQWVQSFSRRVTTSKLARYYLTHPSETLSIAWADLVQEGPQMRSVNLTNYQRKDGFPAGTLAKRFCTWTELRSFLTKTVPIHIPLLYVTLLALAGLKYASGQRRMALVLAGLLAASVWSFLSAVLPDATETNRHLGMFHALTDVVIVVLAWATTGRILKAVAGSKFASALPFGMGAQSSAPRT